MGAFILLLLLCAHAGWAVPVPHADLSLSWCLVAIGCVSLGLA